MTWAKMMAVVVKMTTALLASTPSVDVNKSEVFCMAQAVYWEARGEGTTGQMAIASVVKNRMADPRFPKTACRVVKQAKQFSPNITNGAVPTDEVAWASAVEIATFTLAGYLTDPVPGALYFQRHKEAGWWTARYPKTVKLATVGGHQFFTLKTQET